LEPKAQSAICVNRGNHPDRNLRASIAGLTMISTSRAGSHCERSEAIHTTAAKKEWIALLRSQ
jgi:hypothetical protein